MSDGTTSARFVRIVGWVFLLAAILGLVISAGQVMLLFGAAPGRPLDLRALAMALGLVVLSASVIVVSTAFLRRRPWARPALGAVAVIDMVASLSRLLVPATPIEPPPPNAPAEYERLLQIISIVDIVAPLAACVALGWILWRLQSPTVRDQFH